MTKQIEAAGAFYRIWAEDSALRKSLEDIQRRMQAAGKAALAVGAGIAGAGTAILAPLVAAAGKFSEIGSEIADAASRTGASTEFLSALGYAAQQTGSDLGAVEGGLKKMEKTMLAAERGSKKTLDTLDRLGISAADLKGKSPEDAFTLFADKLSQVDDVGKRAALAMEVFGGSGQKLLPILNGGASGIASMRAEAESLGIVLGQDQADSADALGDAWDKLQAALAGATIQVGSALAPALTILAGLVTGVVTSVTAWIQANPGLIQGLAIVGAGLVAVGTVVASVGTAMILGGAAVGALSTAIGAIGTVFAAVLSPMGLVVAAVVGAGAAFLSFADTGRGAFEGLFGELSGTLSAVVEALTRGDVSTAGQILWTELKSIWARGVNALKDTWNEWKTFAIQVVIEAMAGLGEAIANGWATLKSLWTRGTSFLSDGWSLFTKTISDLWAGAYNFIAGGLIRLRGLLDQSFDADGALSELTKAAEQAANARQSALEDKLAANEEEKEQDLKAIEDARKARLADLEKFRRDATEGNFARRDEEEKRLNDELRSLRDELKKRTEQVRAPRADPSADTKTKVDDIRDELVDGVKDADKTLKSAGTFEARFLSQQFAGSDADRQLQEAKLTREEIKQLRKDLKNVKLVFVP